MIKYTVKEDVKIVNKELKEKTPVDELIDIIGEDLIEIE